MSSLPASPLRPPGRSPWLAVLGLSAAVGFTACTSDAGSGTDSGSPSERRAFVETLGNDTLAYEVFTRTADRIEGQVVGRNPATIVARYAAELGDDGTVNQFEVVWSTPPGAEAQPPDSFVVRLGGAEATVMRSTANGADTVMLETTGPVIPITGRLPVAVGLVEQVVRQARAAGGDSFEFTMLWPRRGQTSSNVLTRHGPTEASIDFFGNPMYVSLDEAGRVIGMSGHETTLRVEVAPTDPDVELTALASDYAARDAAGQGLGVPSPQATAVGQAAGAKLEVQYSQPATRGRQIWGDGGLVGYGSVWRTGANAATHLSTDADLIVGDVDLPAGTYTLWTLFSEDEASLIINSQTQIWGTAYDASNDLARVSMEVEELDAPIERFTIEIIDGDDGGVLTLSWDRRRYSVPIRAG